ncbi:hypothetical protein BO70DRAFT_361895 [Aspergillus heteromorphus CBS 117.55]|uniref:Uncharacterized protein n=1 Tax=Aspergillus heteromorphus CBS 117.55 TaxID=1448321 RepID=A0A317WB03_9EURO|nr:uncharacterized protein BO70DRAFT_361895 [Aspergillus heteromorphus CBS 117.55]PWY82971.1 hypothetical protein BO70DRAFT_361895 [Aspergillus heteromorphus CBS 117.55]
MEILRTARYQYRYRADGTVRLANGLPPTTSVSVSDFSISETAKDLALPTARGIARKTEDQRERDTRSWSYSTYS